MEVFTPTEFNLRKKEILAKIKQGSIFIYPTDTIYGIGCNALNQSAVEKIRKLKNRPDNPFSIFIPNLNWIKDNCLMEKNSQSWLKKLPGPYTFIIKLKNKKSISANVNCNKETIGVRYPDHWFREIVAELGFPIVTTSVNKSSEPFMTSLKDLNSDIEKGVEFIIYEGEKKGHPSKIVDLSNGEVKER